MVLSIKKDRTHENPANAVVRAELEKDEIVNLNFQISKAKRQQLKMRVAGEGRKIGEVMNELIDTYLENT